jgi:oligoribonuclease NrnB/cAMP/cGMP phosphodiesterase (DHH superfamily)
MTTDTYKDIVVIYHGDCPDGFGAAYAAWKKFGDNATYLPWKEHTVLPDGLVDKTIFIVDFSFREPHLKTLNEKNKSVIVIDHHKTAEAEVTAYTQNIFDINHSGCVLAWKYFNPDTDIPALLHYVEDNDIWRHALPEYREFLVSLHQHPMTFESWDNLINSLKTEDNLILLLRGHY